MWRWVVYVWKELVQEIDPVTLSQSPQSKEAKAFYSKPNIILPRPQLPPTHPDEQAYHRLEAHERDARAPLTHMRLTEEYWENLDTIKDLQAVLEKSGVFKYAEVKGVDQRSLQKPDTVACGSIGTFGDGTIPSEDMERNKPRHADLVVKLKQTPKSSTHNVTDAGHH